MVGSLNFFPFHLSRVPSTAAIWLLVLIVAYLAANCTDWHPFPHAIAFQPDWVHLAERPKRSVDVRIVSLAARRPLMTLNGHH